MAATNKIELYIANSLEELNKRAEDNPSIEKAKSSTCSQITNAIEKTWAEAKKAELSNDEERAYVLYMRLFSCFKILKQAKDIANNQVNKLGNLKNNNFNLFICFSKQSTVQYYQKGALIWLEKAEQLSISLKER